jgi:hypothetical protein
VKRRANQTKDLLYVQRFLGHRSISNTMLYIQIEETLFGEAEQYICKVAKIVEEAIPLIEEGYTQASEFDEIKLFRKPKELSGVDVVSGGPEEI